MRLLAVFLLVVSSVYGAGVCQCPPSIIAFINGTNYSNSFTVTPLSNNQGYNISGSISNPPFFTFTLTNFNTQPDPEIDFGMSLSGDPTVSLIITQTFLGGPFPNFFANSSGTITDANNDGHASLLGSPFIVSSFVDGVLVNQQITGCDLTGTPGFTSACPTGTTSQNLLLAQRALGVSSIVPPHGTLEVDISFALSEGDRMTLNGSSILSSAAEVPEPAGWALLTGGVLVLTGLARRRALSH